MAQDGEGRVVKGDITQIETPSAGAAPKEPGWHPDRMNPNDQMYWDGQAWIARRRWSQGGWVTVGDGAGSAAAQADLLSANPYAQPAGPPKATRSQVHRSAPDAPMSLGLVLLLASGVLLVVGSATTWIHASTSFGAFFHLSLSANGLDPAISSQFGVNGYATLTCGVVMIALSCACMASDDSQLRVLTMLTGATSFGFSIYFVVRVVQKISDSTSHGTATVGVGLILLAIGGFLAAAISFARLLQST